MAAPTAPTLSSISSEALKRAGYSNPSSALTTQAQDEWMEEIKNDIWTVEKRLKNLHTTSITILTVGKSRYTFPSDYGTDMTMVLMNGDTTGTAQAGAVGSITLASDDDGTESDYQGKEIVVTGNTGQGSISQIVSFNSTTKVATVSPSFTTAPDSSSTYMIIDSYYDIERQPVWEFDKIAKPQIVNRPSVFYPLGDSDNGEFLFDKAPDVAYPTKLRYYADLMEIDLAGTLMATLYKNYRNVWIKGIVYRSFKQDLDDREEIARKEYEAALARMISEEKSGSPYESHVGEVQMVLD